MWEEVQGSTSSVGDRSAIVGWGVQMLTRLLQQHSSLLHFARLPSSDVED